MADDVTTGGHGGSVPELPERDEIPCGERQEIELIGRGVRLRWPSSDEQRAKDKQKLEDTLAWVKNPRNVAMLTRILVSMEGQNQKDEHFNIEHHRQLAMEHERRRLDEERAKQHQPNVNVNVAVAQVVNTAATDFDHDEFARKFDEFAKSGRFGDGPAPADGA